MKILFLTLGRMNDIDEKGIYTDLLRCFRNHGHQVYVVSALERREKKKTEYIEEKGIHILKVKIGNIKKCGVIEKGISTVLIEGQFKKAIQKYMSCVKFDMVMYSTPPITFVNVVRYIKKRDNALCYLLLKDIFPQNAVDLGMLTKRGVKGLIYGYFRRKEKDLYRISDKIGCMSQANVEYVKRHNPNIKKDKIEICPNCIEVQHNYLFKKEKNKLRSKYKIPLDKTVFVYGGNLGKPQGINFLLKCLLKLKKREDIFFCIVGDGTEYKKIENFLYREKLQNVRLIKRLPKEDYEKMICSCDIGMIFLDNRFTIPNFPSRILSYMQAKIPVLAVTDSNTDIGKVISEGRFGWWCESNNADSVVSTVNHIMNNPRVVNEYGENAFKYLVDNYTVENAYSIIMK